MDGEGTVHEAAELADEAADELLRGRVVLERSLLQAFMYPERGTDELMQAAESVIPVFHDQGYDRGLAVAWLLVAEAHSLRCQIGLMEEALTRAATHTAPESRAERSELGNARARAALAGPLPVPDASASTSRETARCKPSSTLSRPSSRRCAATSTWRGGCTRPVTRH